MIRFFRLSPPPSSAASLALLTALLAAVGPIAAAAAEEAQASCGTTPRSESEREQLGLGLGPLCSEGGLWGTAGCLAARSGALAWDAATFTAERSLPPGARSSIAALVERLPSAPAPLKAAFGAAAKEANSSGEGALGAAGRLATQAVASAASRLLPEEWRRACSQAMEGWRSGFVEAFPAHAPLLPSTDLLPATFAWLLLASFLASRGARLLYGCCRRRRSSPEVIFFPDKTGRHVARICKELASTRRRLFLAMFTLTDDVLSAEVLRAHARGVDVRIIVDDEQSEALGSDVQRLFEAGVPVVLDDSPARMHHKFAVLDNVVLSGSFNWTRQASRANCENLCFMRDSAMVEAFSSEFSRLWREFRRRGRKPSRGAGKNSAGRRKRDGTPGGS